MKYGRRHSLQRQCGLTLIELLLGLTIGSMILSACAVVFATALDSWQAGSRAQSTLRSAQALTSLLDRHLRSALPPEDWSGGPVFSGLDLNDGETHGHRLILFSGAPGRFPRSSAPTDAAEVEFTFDPAGEDGGLTLRIDTTPDDEPDAGGIRVLLDSRVIGFQVRYHDGQEWLDEWQDQTLPLAVEYTLSIGTENPAPNPTTEVPPFIVRRLLALPRAEPADSAFASPWSDTNPADDEPGAAEGTP